MKISELTGAQLDYWVAKAEELPIEALRGEDVVIGTTPNRYVFAPTRKWADGGPIIDRKKVNIQNTAAGIKAAVYQPHALVRWYSAPTVLVAAMRAYVASKFGEEVSDA